MDPDAFTFYRHALQTLLDTGVPFMVGGAFAFAQATGIQRDTKDFDVFIHRRDREPILAALEAAGYTTETPFPHWLAKAHCGDRYIDVIYGSGNGVAEVDDEWFAHATEGDVLGLRVKLCPVEEMIWSKGFIMERERFDGADVAHLLHAYAEQLDWERLLRRYGPYWRVLLAHLVLFGLIYPSERNKIPLQVMAELTNRLLAEQQASPPRERICQGTLLSRAQYLIDVEQWGYQDARVEQGHICPQDLEIWTAAIKPGT